MMMSGSTDPSGVDVTVSTEVKTSDGGFSNPLYTPAGSAQPAAGSAQPSADPLRQDSSTDQAPPAAGPSTSTPVVFQNTREGEATVAMEQPTVRSGDGEVKIYTGAYTYAVHPAQTVSRKQLREKDIIYYKIFSIVATVLFFPTGLVALSYFFKYKKAYYDGIQRGDMDLAIKYAKYIEKLLLCTIILFVFVAVIVVVIIDKVVISKTPFQAPNSSGFNHG